MKIVCKALMNNGVFVDPTRLHDGIYSKELPSIYPQDTTIDMMCQQAKLMTDLTGKCWLNDEYFKNLRSCELVDIEISVKQDAA